MVDLIVVRIIDLLTKFVARIFDLIDSWKGRLACVGKHRLDSTVQTVDKCCV